MNDGCQGGDYKVLGRSGGLNGALDVSYRCAAIYRDELREPWMELGDPGRWLIRPSD